MSTPPATPTNQNGKIEIDTSSPFASVKDALSMFNVKDSAKKPQDPTRRTPDPRASPLRVQTDESDLLRGQLSKALEENNTLSQELEKAAATQSALLEQQRATAALQAKLEDNQRTLKELGDSLASKESQIENLQTEIAAAKAAEQAAVEKAKVAAGQPSDAEKLKTAEVEELKRKLLDSEAQLKKQMEVLTTQINAGEAEKRQLTAQLDSLKSKSTADDAQRSQLSAQLDSLKSEKVSLEKQLAAASVAGQQVSAGEAEKKQLSTQLEGLKSEKASLEQKLAAASVAGQQIAAGEAEKKQLSAQLDSLTSEKASLEKELAAALADAKAAKETSEVGNQPATSDDHSRAAELEELRQKLQAAEEQGKSTQLKLEAAEAEVKSNKEKLQELEQQLKQKEDVALPKEEVKPEAPPMCDPATEKLLKGEVDALKMDKQVLQNELAASIEATRVAKAKAENAVHAKSAIEGELRKWREEASRRRSEGHQQSPSAAEPAPQLRQASPKTASPEGGCGCVIQ